MHRDLYHPQVKKDLKKFDEQLRQEIERIHIPAILEHPELGEELTGDLNGIMAYHFNHQKLSCRIAYVVDDAQGIIFFMMIGKRENFYTILKRRV